MMRSILSVLGVVLFSVLSVFGQDRGADLVKINPVPVLKGGAGDTVNLVVTVTVAKGFYTYGMDKAVGPDGLGPDATALRVKPKNILKQVGKIIKPKGKVVFDSTYEVNITKLVGTFTITVPVRIDPTLKKGSYKAAPVLETQICDAARCFPLDEISIPVTVEVTKEADQAVLPVVEEPAGTDTAPTTAVQKPAAPVAAPQTDIEREQSKGLLNFFFYAMGIGFVALLTPCVFPMIPITVSFFTKRHEKSKGKGLRDSVVFGTGIVATFTAVGIIVSAIFGGTAVQDLAANPWLNLGIGLLFVILAFNLFGAFEIQVPVSIMNALNKKSQGDGVLAVWLMGLTFALTSFTCTVPFIGTLLLSAASAQDANAYIYPAVGTLGFATAFAIPFVLLSMFPALLMKLPRAGGWMNNLKVVMGFLEIAAAIKFFSTAEFVWNMGVLPREPFLAIWAGVCFLIVLYILGVFAMKLDSPVDRVSGIRAFFAVIFASMGFYFLGGMMGKPLAADLEALLPPDNYQELIEGSVGGALTPPTTGETKNADAPKEVWLTSLDEAKKLAKETGKPIFIDFTGFACTNCRWMEKRMFPKASVQERFDKMILVQLFTDRKEEPYITNQNLMREYGTVANPLYVILKPDGSYVGQSAYTRDEQAFLKFLDAAL